MTEVTYEVGQTVLAVQKDPQDERPVMTIVGEVARAYPDGAISLYVPVLSGDPIYVNKYSWDLTALAPVEPLGQNMVIEYDGNRFWRTDEDGVNYGWLSDRGTWFSWDELVQTGTGPIKIVARGVL